MKLSTHIRELALRLHQQELATLDAQVQPLDTYFDRRQVIEDRLTDNLRRAELQRRREEGFELALAPIHQPRQVGDTALLFDARAVL